MTATRSTVDALLKEMYEGDVNDMLNEEEVTHKRIEKTADGVIDTIGGKIVVFPVRNRRNKGISYRPENTALASPGKQGYARATEDVKYGYGRFAVTGPTMELAETNQQAFMSAMDGEMEGLKQDLKKDRNRIVLGHPDEVTAKTGIIAKITNVASTVLTVDYVARFDIEEEIDVINPGTGTARGTVTITAIDYAAGTITISAAVTGAAANDYITRTGNWDQEPHGILGLIGDTGTMHGINSATAGNEYWRSQVDSTTTTLTEQAMIAMCDRIRQRGGNKPTAVFCSLGVRRAYYNIMLSSRRYVDPKEFPGGLVGLSFNHGKEIPVVEDPDMPAKTMVLPDEKEIKIFRNKDWYFDDTDGSILKWKSGFDTWEGMAKCYWQMGTHKRNAHGKFTNITEPTA